MSKRKRPKSQQNYGLPKERPGRIVKYSNPIQRTQEQRSRAVALRNARMRLLNPYDPVNILQTAPAIHQQKSIKTTVPIKGTKNRMNYPIQWSKIMTDKTPCQQKAQRRAVLLAKGKVQHAGGAPGPYKPRTKVVCK